MHSAYNSSSFTENVRFEQIFKGHGIVFQAYGTAVAKALWQVPDVFEEQQKSTCGCRRVNGENERLKRK